jgi:hypothetical protein
MKKVVFISAMLLIVMGAGCSNIYEGLRMQQEMECQNSLEPSGTSAPGGPA